MASLIARLRLYDMRTRDYIAVFALALSGFFSLALVIAGALIWLSARWSLQVKAYSTLIPLALFSLSASLSGSSGNAAAFAAMASAIAGILLALNLYSRPAQPLEMPPRTAAVS
jgi:hypothetical protein